MTGQGRAAHARFLAMSFGFTMTRWRGFYVRGGMFWEGKSRWSWKGRAVGLEGA